MKPKWQVSTRRSQLRSGVQSKARAFLRKLDKLEAAKKAKDWVDPTCI